MNKEKVLRFIQMKGWSLILIFLLSFVGWYYLLGSINEYKKEEVFSIFTESYGIKNDKLLDPLLDEYKEHGIQKLNHYNFSSNDSHIADYYQRFGESSDLVILNEQELIDMKEFVSTKYYSKDEVLNYFPEWTSEYQFYSYQEIYCGLKIYDKNDSRYNAKFNFNSFLEFENENNPQSYYLMINRSSVHFNNDSLLGRNITRDILEVIKNG